MKTREYEADLEKQLKKIQAHIFKNYFDQNMKDEKQAQDAQRLIKYLDL